MQCRVSYTDLGSAGSSRFQGMAPKGVHIHRASVDCLVLSWRSEPRVRRPIYTWMMLRADFWVPAPFWTRANPEPCLLATRGKPKRHRADVRKLIISPRREHSRKPEEAYERIEALCEGPYLEMFARASRAGWDRWGNEADASGSGQRRWGANSYPDAFEAAD